MNKKEVDDIGLDLYLLMISILDEKSNSEDIANNAISFCKEILSKHPKLKDIIDLYVTSNNEEDISKSWDREIAWIEFQKEL